VRLGQDSSNSHKPPSTDTPGEAPEQGQGDSCEHSPIALAKNVVA
jgi:hypothetical protein